MIGISVLIDVEIFHFSLFNIFICAVCSLVNGNRISFLFWLGLLAVNFLNSSILFIGCLESLACCGNKMRAVPWMFFWGQRKSIYLNSTPFRNIYYIDWNTILNQIFKESDIARSFVTSRTISELPNVGIPRIFFTDTLLPRPIKSRVCLPFFQCRKCGMLHLSLVFH